MARIRLKDGEEVTVEADDLEIVRELGRGAYGVVEQMKHRPSGTEIAVKVDLFVGFVFITMSYVFFFSLLDLSNIKLSRFILY